MTPHATVRGPRYGTLQVVTWTTVLAVAVATGLALLDLVGQPLRRI
ncbi:MAG TPA: hypothetical protein VMH24_04775 [Candidatus Sulfotelmatobacter sp.]|nr:hypothetical protein [Candidatus Sulfotelmatobacter sp.]